MRYPTINQYLESLSNPHLLFRTLGEFSIERDLHGDISFLSGNYSTVFKISTGCGTTHALKCYTRAPEHAPLAYHYLKTRPASPYIVRSDYLEKEVFVYDEYERGRYCPVALCEWIEGETLGQVVERLCHRKDRHACLELEKLAGEFDRMALWLLGEEFAHGDLKHDNILITRDNKLRLIDYDGIYFPAMEGHSCSLVGSPVYQHPTRDATFFNRHIDDYPIAVISVSLHALAEDPQLYERYNEMDNLILNPQRIAAGDTELLDRLETQWMYDGRTKMVKMCRMLRSPSPKLTELQDILEALCDGSRKSFPEGMQVADDSDPSLAIVRFKGRYGYADFTASALLLEPLFKEAKPFSESLAAVRMPDGWCFIDVNGRVAVNCSHYDAVEPFREGLALVRRGGLYGFINKNGHEVIPPRFAFATGFNESLAAVRVSQRYGYIDKSGKLLIADEFDFAGRFRNGTAQVEKDGKMFRIDRSGNLIRTETQLPANG